MTSQTKRILGVDTSLRCTGLGVVEARGQKLKPVQFGLIKNKPDLPHTGCLDRIYNGIVEIIAETKPDAVAVEGIFHHRNARTAMVLGQARGAVLAACAGAGVPVYEYSPRKVKQAVVGAGAAHKDQVGHMIVRLLGLKEAPPEDAADALAIAITHLHAITGKRAELPPTI